MRNFWLLTKREWSERVMNRTFLWMLFIGPLVCLLMLSFLFKAGDEGKNSINVLIFNIMIFCNSFVATTKSTHAFAKRQMNI